MASDYLRTENAPNMVNWNADVFDQTVDFALQHTDVTIGNLGSGDFTIRVPSIALDGVASNLEIFLDAGTDQVTVIDLDAGQSLFQGPFSDLVNLPPPGISIDQETFREINKAGPPSQPLLGTLPREHSSLHSPTDPMNSLNIKVLDPRNNQPLAWTASSDNPLVTLSSNSSSSSAARSLASRQR